MMANREIKEAAKKSGVRMWQIAERIGVHEGTFCRKMRHDVSQQERVEIMAIIAELAARKTEAPNA